MRRRSVNSGANGVDTTMKNYDKLLKIEEHLDYIAEALLDMDDIKASPVRTAAMEGRVQNVRTAIDLAYDDPVQETFDGAENIAKMFFALAATHGISFMRKENRDAQKQRANKHERDARTDALTQSNNRSVYHEQIKAAALHAQDVPDANGNKQYFALVMFDLDRFKGLNDDYGHDVGDAGLMAFSDLLKKTTRSDSGRDELFSPFGRLNQHGGDKSMSRLGGDEFTLIMNTRAPSLEEATHQFEQGLNRLKADLEVACFECKDMNFPLVSSAGMHVLDADDTAQSAYIKADTALAEHKKSKQARYDNAVDVLTALEIPNLQTIEDKRAVELSALRIDDVISALNTLKERGALKIHISPDQELTNAAEILEEFGMTIVYDDNPSEPVPADENIPT
tara:strand:+ start:4415 stop:5599 length:1185 start_codon:yes stop_codon:yes gene_type:complete